MGILESVHRIRLSLNEQEHLSGDLLKGQVQLYVSRSCLEASLLLKVCGREVCCWDNSQTSDQEAKGKHRIFTQKVELQKWKQKLKRGLYVFPFEVQLPDRLPASFDLRNQFYSASINYTVKATFQSRGKRVSDSYRFRLTTESPDLPSNAIVLDSLFPIKRCCFSSASVTTAAYLEKTWFCSWEDVVLDVSVARSNLSVEVREVTVDLVRRTRLKNNSQGISAVYHEVVHGYHTPVQFPPGQTRFPAFRISFSLPQISKRTDLTHTIHSLFLENVFFIEIQVNLEWFFCLRAESPTLEVPIDILDLSRTMTYVPPFPGNWHSEALQTSVVEIEKADMTPSAPPLEFS